MTKHMMRLNTTEVFLRSYPYLLTFDCEKGDCKARISISRSYWQDVTLGPNQLLVNADLAMRKLRPSSSWLECPLPEYVDQTEG